jgi:hypothetical protein
LSHSSPQDDQGRIQQVQRVGQPDAQRFGGLVEHGIEARMTQRDLFGQRDTRSELLLDSRAGGVGVETPPPTTPATRAMSIDGDVSDLSRHSGMAAPEVVAQRYGTSDAGADSHEQHAIRSFVPPFLELGHSRAVHVIVDYAGYTYRRRDQLSEGDVPPAVEHDAPAHSTPLKVDLPGKADAHHIKGSIGILQLACRSGDEMAGFHWSRVASGCPDGASQEVPLIITQAGE